MSTDNSHPVAYSASLRVRREEILNHFEYDLYERQDFSTPSGYPNTLRDTLQVLVQGDLSSEINAARRVATGSIHHYWFREEFQSLVYGLIHTLQTMLDDLVVATADDMNNPPPVWRFESPKGCLVNQFCGPKSRSGASAACSHLAMRCSLAIRMYRDYRAQIMEKLASPRHISTLGLKSDVKSSLDYQGPVRKPAGEGYASGAPMRTGETGLSCKSERVGRTSSHVPSSCSVGSRGRSAPLGLAGGQTSLVSSRADVKSPSSRNTVNFSPQDAGPSTKDLDAHSAAHHHALAQGDRMRAIAGGQTAVPSVKAVRRRGSSDTEKLSPQGNGKIMEAEDLHSHSTAPRQASAQGDHLSANAGGQTAVSSCNDVKPQRSRNAEWHAPQFFHWEAVTRTSRSLSPAAVGVALSSAQTDGDVARRSGLLKGLEVASSTPPSFSPAYVSPGPSRSSSCEMKAQNLRDIDDRAVQKVEARSSSMSRGHILSPSRDDAKATAPPALPLTARAIRPSGMRAAEAVNSNEYITKDCEQRREEDEGITCGSSADGHDLTSVALPRQFSKKPTSPDTSSRAHAVAKTRAKISSHGSRDDEKRSPQGAQPEYNENPAKYSDWDGQDCALHVSADSLSPSPSAAPHRHAACKPPDRATLNSSSPHSCELTSHPRSAAVPSTAPSLRSSRWSTTESGPDSVNWRTRGQLATLLPGEVGTHDAGLRSKSIAKCDRGKSPAQFPDSDGHCRPPRASAGGLSPSPSTALHRQATCEPPDKTNSNDSSLHSGQSTSRPRSATVPSAAPPFRSSYSSTSESGPDSANWRARRWLKASSRQEVGAVEADSRDKSISKCEKDSPHGSPHRSHREASSQAFAQDRPQVYAGGQVLASSRRDAKPDSSSNVEKHLPQGVESDTFVTVPDDSVRARATVEPCAEISSHGLRDTPERSP
ncbi:hypothetical protein EV122DRAFT_226814, partial [Schizophyllum commune]